MDKYRKFMVGISAIILGILLGMCSFQKNVVRAAEEIGDGIINIQLNDLGTPMEGVEFTLYGVDEADKSLVSVGKTNDAGNVVFEDLPEGEYEVVQTNAASYGNVSSFTVTIPYEVNETEANVVNAKVKGELFKQETQEEPQQGLQQETQQVVEVIESVPTGDAANPILYLVLALGIIIYVIGIMVYKKKKRVFNMLLAVLMTTTVMSTGIIGLSCMSVSAESENFVAESEVPEWATNVTVENPPDEQYVYQFSDVCPIYQRGQYRFGCGGYNCAPSPVLLLIDGSEYNTASGKTWTANGVEYVPGVSNYELTYCADFDTSTVKDQFYKKVNVEDSTYFESVEDAYKLRAIVGNTYPFVAAADMVKDLHNRGVVTDDSLLLNGKTFADELTTADIDVGQLIAATQMAVWVTCNDTMNSASVAAGRYTYYTLHPDNTSMQSEGKLNQVKGYPNANDENETEFPMREGQAANINAIYQYLMSLEPVTEEEADANQQLVITDVDYEVVKTGEETFDVKVKTLLNTAIKKNDNLTIKVSASKPDSKGNPIEATKVFTSQASNEVIGKEFILKLKDVPAGSTITIELSGDQYLNQGVYFYEPYVAEGETERSTSQNLVGASVGYTPVKATTSFEIDDIETTVFAEADVVMPSTGGIGATVFYVVGGMLTLGAGSGIVKRATKKKLCGRK